MKKQSILILLFSIPFFGLAQLFTPGAGVTDIDGNTYQTIIINGQEWMSENLRTSKYNDGNLIPEVTDLNEWASNNNTGTTLPMMCWFNNNSPIWPAINTSNLNPNTFGGYYNWFAISLQTNGNRNICPANWNVPSDSQWDSFINFLDSNANGGNNTNIAGGKMKSTESQFWISPNTDATNESGFSGLPGGYLVSHAESFYYVGYNTKWWSSTADGDYYAYNRDISNDGGSVWRYESEKSTGLSIRCIKNSLSNTNEIKPSLKTLIKVFDIMGNETVITQNQLQFYLYSDGSVEKKIVIID
jgi:uncharacterized protein (TIGR02145 family)